MKQEPELIDIFAMFVAAGLAASRVEGPKHFAKNVYVLAAELMEERKKYVGEEDE